MLKDYVISLTIQILIDYKSVCFYKNWTDVFKRCPTTQELLFATYMTKKNCKFFTVKSTD